MRRLLFVSWITLAALAACQAPPRPAPVAPRPRPRAPVASASASASALAAAPAPQPVLDPLAPLPAGAIARCGTPRMRFLSRPMSLAVTDAGTLISVESAKGEGLVARDLNRAAVLGKLPNAGVAALSPDASTVVLSLRKPAGEIAFYRVDGGVHLGSVTVAIPRKQHYARGHMWDSPVSIRDLIYSQDGKRVAVVLSDSSPMYLLDAESRKLLRAVSQKGTLTALDKTGSRGLFVEARFQMFMHDDASAISVLDLNLGTPLRRIEFKKDPAAPNDPYAATMAPLSRASFALAADGKKVLAAEHGELFTIDVASGKRDRLVQHRSASGDMFGLTSYLGSSDLLVSPDGTHVAWSHGGDNVLLDLTDGTEAPATENTPKAFSPNGSMLLAASEHGAEVHGTSVDVPEGHETPVQALAFLSKGNVLVSSAEDLRFWDGRSCQWLRTSGTQGKAGGMAASADGSKLAIQGRELRVIGVDGHIFTLERKDQTDALAISPNGARLAIGSHHYEQGHALSIREKQSAVASVKLETGVKHLAFSPSGNALSVLLERPWGGDKDKSTEPRSTVRNPDNLEVQFVMPSEVGDSASYAQFVGDDDHLLLGTEHHGLTLFDRKQGRVLRRFGWENCCKAMAVSADGALVAGSSDSSIAVWEVATRKFKGVLTGHTDNVRALAFSPTGKTLASGSEDTTILMWDVDKAHAPSRDLKLLPMADASSVRSISGSLGRTWYVTQAGKVALQGSSAAQKVPDIKGAKAVADGGLFRCVLLDNGKVNCWGWTRGGELGIPEERRLKLTLDRDKAVEVPGVSDAVSVWAQGSYACALTRGGGLWCWGTSGGSSSSSAADLKALETRPHLVAEIGTILSASVGGGHTCAVDTNGKVWCWGAGADGELGDGQKKSSMVPVAVAGVTDAMGVAAGESHSCALRKNETVLCWGENSRDQLGDNTGVDSALPVRVAGIDDAVEITSADRFTCVRRRNHGVTCWGRSYVGALSFPEPTELPELAGAQAIQATRNLLCGDLGGSVKCVQ